MFWKFILLFIALVFSLMLVNKMLIDFASSIYGSMAPDQKTAIADGWARFFLICVVSVLWSLIIILW
jgi:hypothetical protein